MIIRDHKLRVYVAGPSAQLMRCLKVVEALRAHPDIITVVGTWTERLPKTRLKYEAKSDRDVPREVLVADLRQDLEEVALCDVLLRLANKSDGAATEWGFGLAKSAATGSPVLIAAGDSAAFELLADVLLGTDEEAVDYVVALAREDADARAASRGSEEG